MIQLAILLKRVDLPPILGPVMIEILLEEFRWLGMNGRQDNWQTVGWTRPSIYRTLSF